MIRAACTAAVALAAVPAAAQDASPVGGPPLTGGATLVSQYRFRGIGRSDNDPAAQATLTVSASGGAYLGVWASTTKAGSGPVALGGGEVDLYAGYARALGTSGWTADGGLYGYLFPGAAGADYFELYGDVTRAYGSLGVKLGLNWAPAQAGFDAPFGRPLGSATRYNLYEYGELTASPPFGPLRALSLHAHLGHTGGGFDYAKSYVDYTAGLTWKRRRLSLDASVVGTNIGDADVARAFGAGAVGYFRRPVKTVGVVSAGVSF